MTADTAAAGRALPEFLLVLEKGIDSLRADRVEISDHAHVIARPVAFVEELQARAGVFITLEAIAHEPVAHKFAGVAHVQAVLSALNAARAVFTVKPLLVQVIFASLIGDAEAAVHSAGCNVLLIHLLHLSLITNDCLSPYAQCSSHRKTESP